MSFGAIVSRGFRASLPAVVAGAYFFLLFAPAQVISAITQSLAPRMVTAPGQPPDLQLTAIILPLGCVNCLFLIALIFLFPLLTGGAIGRVRDYIEQPDQPPGRFAGYGRKFYARLLGNFGLFIACAIVVMLPMICVGMFAGMQNAAEAIRTGQTDPVKLQELNRQIYKQPLTLSLMIVSTLAMTVMGIFFNVANAIVVCDADRVMAAWSKSLSFCQQNLAAVLGLVLIHIGLGIPATVPGMVGALGFIGDLPILLVLAVFQTVCFSVLFVVGVGLSTSLYLARRPAGSTTVPPGPYNVPGQLAPGDTVQNPYRQPGSPI